MTDPPSRAGDLLAHVPEGPVPSSQQGERVLDLVRVMARLRGPGGCPWDAEQTHQTLARHLLEETHELLEAIDADDDDAMRDELGDVLLQVVFHAQMAADDGRWDVDDVAEGLVAKLVYRHPHVFGQVEVAGAEEVLVNWEKLKVAEAGQRAAVDDDIPASLPSLARAAKVQRRAAGWGFEWRSVDAAVEALREEVEELATATDPADAEDEVGDVLFATVPSRGSSASTPRAHCAAPCAPSPIGTSGSSRSPPSGASTSRAPTSPSCGHCSVRLGRRVRHRTGPTRGDIDAARARIAPHVRGTPVLGVSPDTFGVGVPLVLKLELLQVTGSFKPRGAFNRMLTAEVGSAGVVAASGGNFGLAVGHAARALGHRAEIFVPSTSPGAKIDKVRATGADVRVIEGYYDDASAAATERAAETGSAWMHPFDQPEVVAGQGTIGAELTEQVPGIDSVLVAVGGGGLIAGIASWFAGNGVRVVGVEPATSRCLQASLDAGEPVDVTVSGRAADSLGTRRVGDIAFAVASAGLRRACRARGRRLDPRGAARALAGAPPVRRARRSGGARGPVGRCVRSRGRASGSWCWSAGRTAIRVT